MVYNKYPIPNKYPGIGIGINIKKSFMDGFNRIDEKTIPITAPLAPTAE